MQHHTLSCLLALLLPLQALAQSGDGGAADGFSSSNLGTEAANGADGDSKSSANLSKGAIVAIAVVVAVVVVGGITLAVLFYVAKKRQWQVRATIRRTTTRVVRAMTPRTPGFTFPRSPRPGTAQRSQAHTLIDKDKKATADGRNRDVEKGFMSLDEQMARSSEESGENKKEGHGQHSRTTSDVNKKLPKPKMNINVPSSQFEIDSPLKSPMWQRILGRK